MEQSPSSELAQIVKATDSIRDCVVTSRQYSSLGEKQGYYSLRTIEGKYIKSPKKYYQRLSEAEYNYDDQAQQGFQEIYSGDEDIIEMLLPGAFRMLGVVRIFPEDPKVTAMRGEKLKTHAPWDIMNRVSGMAAMGTVSVESAKHKGADCLLIEVVQNPDTCYYYGVNRVRVLADEKTHLPLRIERYAPDQPRPVAWIEYEVFKTDTGLTPDQIRLEGIKSPFSLISPSSGEKVEPFLTPVPIKRLDQPAPDALAMLSGFREAVKNIKDYRAEITMCFRYKRLRLYREDRFAYHRDPYWFTLITTKQKANYLLLNYTAPSMLRYSADDECFHITGGSLLRLMGEQVFSGIDYKFYSPMGDNPYELDLPSLDNLISKFFSSDKASSAIVEYKGRKYRQIILPRKGETPPSHPGRIKMLLDPLTRLPSLVEFSGYDDPKAVMTLTLDNVRINVGLEPDNPDF